ncbi:MAG: sensor histidine kinase [Oscillospiraceae bacterium]
MLKKLRIRLTIIFTSLLGVMLVAALVVLMLFSLDDITYKYSLQFSFAEADIINYASTLTKNTSANTAFIKKLEEHYSVLILTEADDEPLQYTHSITVRTELDELMKKAKDKGIQYNFEIGSLTAEFVSDAYYGSQLIVVDGGQDYLDTEEGTTSSTGSVGIVQGALVLDENGYIFADDIFLSATYGEAVADTGYVQTLQGNQGDSYRISSWNFNFGTEDEPSDILFVLLQDTRAESQEKIAAILIFIFIFLAGLSILAFISWMLAKTVIKPTEKGLQQQTEFVAAASHELRSPLAVVRSSLSAAKTADDALEADKYYQMADSETERMARLIDDLLLLAGGDSGTWKLCSEEVDLDTLLIEASEQLFPIARRNDVTLKLELPDVPLGSLRGDEDRLHQILVVLIDNALQYSPKNSNVILRADKHKNKAIIDIVDHGKGIPDNEKDRVFDRFYRSDSSRTDKSHFGLGLSVAKELAELHEGQLTVHDTKGGGATFRLILPLE